MNSISKYQSFVIRAFALLAATLNGVAHAEPFKVVAYVPNWIDVETFATKIDYNKLTHINIAFENPKNDLGTLSFHPANAVLIKQAHQHEVKVLVSIGGGSMSENEQQKARYFELISVDNRAAFAQAIFDYLVEHEFDGIDVDIEGPAINQDYGAFIETLSNVLKPKGKLVTSALSHGYGGKNVPSSALAYFDFVNVMAYDAAGPWNPNEPGQHSSFDFATKSVDYWIKRGLPKSKAVLGVPFYGYGFGAAFTKSGLSYDKIVAKYAGAENSDQIGSTIWYNGIPTIKAKTKYAVDQELGGVMIWSLDNDATGDKSLLKAIDEARRTVQ